MIDLIVYWCIKEAYSHTAYLRTLRIKMWCLLLTWEGVEPVFFWSV